MIDMPSHIKTAIERQYKLKRSLCEGRWSLVGQYISPGGEVVAIKTARKSAQGPSDLRHEIKALQVRPYYYRLNPKETILTTSRSYNRAIMLFGSVI